MIEQYINYGLLVFALLVGILFCRKIFAFIKDIYNDYRRTTLVKNFADYHGALNFYLEKGYDLLHKDRILIYSLEATTLPDKEFDKVSKEFVKLVEKSMGPRFLKELIFFYGTHDALTFAILEYFHSKYEIDEIRKTAIENLQEKEIEE